jgi:hypothetical protein
MSAKPVRLRAVGPPRGTLPIWPGRSVDNRTGFRVAAVPRRTGRPVLVCHWQPIIGGGRLECRWQIGAMLPRRERPPAGCFSAN